MSTTKKPATSKSVAKRVETQAAPAKSNLPATPIDWRAIAAKSLQQQKATAAKLPQSGGNTISWKGGVITVGGVRQPNPWPTIILAAGYERGYHERDYDPNNPTAPDCYSFDGVAPHPESLTPQSEACQSCPMNRFGSAGKGKACREGAKLALVPADAAKNADAMRAQGIANGKVSVLNSKTFTNYVGALGDTPLWSVITTITDQPDPKSQYALDFEASILQADDDVMSALAGRLDEANAVLTKPYSYRTEEEAKPAQQRARPRKF